MRQTNGYRIFVWKPLKEPLGRLSERGGKIIIDLTGTECKDVKRAELGHFFGGWQSWV